jgi:hypothetical protein
VPVRHPDLDPLAFLVGAWSGGGRGAYPTVEPFDYLEEIAFEDAGGRFLRYEQRTRNATGDRPLHTEVGYLRPGRPGFVEWVVVQPTGIAEVAEGVVEGTSLRVRSRVVGLTRTAKRVETVERLLRVEGDGLTSELLMGAVGEPHQVHLQATLTRR